jgi:tRNA A-37 threonylcarbamoyl transferase component Bud32
MRFISRKNQVTLENGAVVKRYADKSALLREEQALKRLYHAGLAVPLLLGGGEDFLLMEYISGETYEALTERMTPDKAEALAGWLEKYHRIAGCLKGDVNLRNFLWTGKECVGLDFEDIPIMGEPEIDMGKMIAFALTYKPSFSAAKAECARLMLKAFVKAGGRKEKIREFYLEEILQMNCRRPNDYIEMETAVRSWAEIDKQEGNDK